MEQRINKLLFDIRSSIESIEEFVGAQRDFSHYMAQKQLRRAVEREIEIIGEAVGKLLVLDPEIPIDNARRIVDTRNFVIHAYDSVDDAMIWSIVVKHLPMLKRQVVELMEKQ